MEPQRSLLKWVAFPFWVYYLLSELKMHNHSSELLELWGQQVYSERFGMSKVHLMSTDNRTSGNQQTSTTMAQWVITHLKMKTLFSVWHNSDCFTARSIRSHTATTQNTPRWNYNAFWQDCWPVRYVDPSHVLLNWSVENIQEAQWVEFTDVKYMVHGTLHRKSTKSVLLSQFLFAKQFCFIATHFHTSYVA